MKDEITLKERLCSAMITGLIVAATLVGTPLLMGAIVDARDIPPTVNFNRPVPEQELGEIGEPACWPATCLEAR